MGVRAVVADAINAAAITGLTGVEWPPATPLPGLAWAQFRDATPGQYAGGVGFDSRWTVLAALPAETPRRTAETLDLWLPLLLACLHPLGVLETAAPVQLTYVDGQSAPALSISLAPPGN